MSARHAIGSRRHRSERVKTAKNRKISSTRGLRRHLNDPFVKEAKANGYRCRAAFKLIEIDQKYKIFKKNLKVLDLGSAPGGWSQIIVEKVGHGNVLAVDIQEMPPIEGVSFIKKNFLADDTRDVIISQFCAEEIDAIISDMAPNTSGDRETDHMRTIELAERALDLAIDILKENGSFVSKIFQGAGENEFVTKLKKYFGKVSYFKPESSRKDSPEVYIIAQYFNAPLTGHKTP